MFAKVFFVLQIVATFFSGAAALATVSVKEVDHFPQDFRFGIATAAYQIEGAWNVSDKGENVWDHFTHHQSHKIRDHSTGDVACDSYHLWRRDVEMLRELGVNFYRFSISWARLLPRGLATGISQDGLRYYNDLIDELVKYNITPMVTLFHWDTPQVLQDIGGWTNPLIVEYFEDYARVAFEHFGDRVKEWITFNEPYNMCLFGYGSRTGFVVFAPDMNFHGIGEYECAHNVLKAHGRVYHMYNDTFRETQKGKIGMATFVMWAEPETLSPEDLAIVQKTLQFNVGWFLHPIHNPAGDYPDVMKEEIASMSRQQGFRHSRLPTFTKEEVQMLKGTSDFIGLNYYTAVVFNNSRVRPQEEIPSHSNDLGYHFYQREEWQSGASAWLKLRPEGLRGMLNWIADEYGRNEELVICECGYSSRGGLLDEDRVSYFRTHLRQLLAARNDGCKVTGFTAWSLMDNFEWVNGYTERFGLYEVNFKSPNKTRTPRMSALVYKEIIRSKALNDSYTPVMVEVVQELEEQPGLVEKPPRWLVTVLGVAGAIIILGLLIKCLRTGAYGH